VHAEDALIEARSHWQMVEQGDKGVEDNA
jgi:hypothetical protein